MSALPPKGEVGASNREVLFSKLLRLRRLPKIFLHSRSPLAPFPSFPRQHRRTMSLTLYRHSGTAVVGKACLSAKNQGVTCGAVCRHNDCHFPNLIWQSLGGHPPPAKLNLS